MTTLSEQRINEHIDDLLDLAHFVLEQRAETPRWRWWRRRRLFRYWRSTVELLEDTVLVRSASRSGR